MVGGGKPQKCNRNGTKTPKLPKKVAKFVDDNDNCGDDESDEDVDKMTLVQASEVNKKSRGLETRKRTSKTATKKNDVTTQPQKKPNTRLMNQSAVKRSAADQTIEQLQHQLAEAKAREEQALAKEKIARSDANKLCARLRSFEDKSGKQNSIDSMRYKSKQYDKDSPLQEPINAVASEAHRLMKVMCPGNYRYDEEIQFSVGCQVMNELDIRKGY